MHNRLLAAVGREVESPLHPLSLPEGWLERPAVRAIGGELKAYLRGEIAREKGIWGFKDPRTARLLPLWNRLFQELELSPTYFWAVRSPPAAARSMALKNPRLRKMTVAFAELLWATYNVDIFRALRDLRPQPAVIDFDSWFDNAENLVGRLTAALEIDPPSEATIAEVRVFVQARYRHQQPSCGSDAPCNRFEKIYLAIRSQPMDISAIEQFSAEFDDGYINTAIQSDGK